MTFELCYSKLWGLKAAFKVHSSRGPGNREPGNEAVCVYISTDELLQYTYCYTSCVHMPHMCVLSELWHGTPECSTDTTINAILSLSFVKK